MCEAIEESLETSLQALEVVSNAYVESLPVQPRSSSVALMVARVILGHGYEPETFGFSICAKRGPTITTNPLAGGRRETHWCVFQGWKTSGVATNVYLRKTLEKQKAGL